MMNIALIAHDVYKDDIVNFTIAYHRVFQQHSLFATGTTGARIMEEADLSVNRMRSGPFGGDQQIGAMVAQNDLDLVIFLRDPLMAQPHEPDITALLRLCDVQCIPVATNMATAELLVKSLERGDFGWRDALRSRTKEMPLRRNGTE